MIQPLLTTAEVAGILRVHEETIRRMRLDGLLPFVRVGATIRFRVEDILAWIEANMEGTVCAEALYAESGKTAQAYIASNI